MWDNLEIGHLGHPSSFTLSDKQHKMVAEELIERIGFTGALGYTAPKTIITAQKIPYSERKGDSRLYNRSFRLDFQGPDSDKHFERFAIQCGGSQHFAQIHIRKDIEFGVKRIQEAFRESLKVSKDIWLPPKEQLITEN